MVPTALRLAPLLIASVALACGAEHSGADATDSSTTSTTTDTDTPTGEPTTGDTGPDEPASTSGGSDSLGGDSSGEPDATTTDATTGASEWDGEPLPPNPPGAWMWVDFPESRCRNGSATGIGIRHGTSDELVIFFEGGGACFNTATCLLNDAFADLGSLKFGAWKLAIGGGIFNNSTADSPVADWNFVYVPYCTGDVHAGDKTDGGVPGVFGAQQFVGYRNVGHYLERLVPTFAETSHVLITGQSAGSFARVPSRHGGDRRLARS